MNLDGASLTLDEMERFTKQAKGKYGCPGDTVVRVQAQEGVVVFNVPVNLVHRALAPAGRTSGSQPMRGARRPRR